MKLIILPSKRHSQFNIDRFIIQIHTFKILEPYIKLSSLLMNTYGLNTFLNLATTSKPLNYCF